MYTYFNVFSYTAVGDDLYSLLWVPNRYTYILYSIYYTIYVSVYL